MSLCFPSADGSATLAATLGRSAEQFALEVIRSRSSASLLKGSTGQAWIQARISASLMGTCLMFLEAQPPRIVQTWKSLHGRDRGFRWSRRKKKRLQSGGVSMKI